jgi:hypothetical protein
MRSDYKKIALIIEVPKGEYCWQGRTPCEYFDNEGGHGRCEIPGMFVREESKGSCNVLKDPKCAASVEQEGE